MTAADKEAMRPTTIHPTSFLTSVPAFGTVETDIWRVIGDLKEKLTSSVSPEEIRAALGQLNEIIDLIPGAWFLDIFQRAKLLVLNTAGDVQDLATLLAGRLEELLLQREEASPLASLSGNPASVVRPLRKGQAPVVYTGPADNDGAALQRLVSGQADPQALNDLLLQALEERVGRISARTVLLGLLSDVAKELSRDQVARGLQIVDRIPDQTASSKMLRAAEKVRADLERRQYTIPLKRTDIRPLKPAAKLEVALQEKHPFLTLIAARRAVNPALRSSHFGIMNPGADGFHLPSRARAVLRT